MNGETETSKRRAALCIKMLTVLNSGRTYKTSELADILGTNPRNIIEYKNELTDAGYNIVSVPGRYGGYRLDRTELFPAIKLTSDEAEALKKANEYLCKRLDFMYKKECASALGKVLSSQPHDNEDGTLSIINRFPLAMSEEEIKIRYDFINKCIAEKAEARFSYLSQKNEEKEYVIHPYELFTYNNAWFFIGWSDAADGARYFKLNRIAALSLTGRKFTVRRAYRRGDYLDENGFKNYGDWHHIEFIAYGKYAMIVKERIYGRNQIVTPIDKKSTKVSVEMQNKDEILSFILGMGAEVKVIEQSWLIEEIATTLKEIADKYN